MAYGGEKLFRHHATRVGRDEFARGELGVASERRLLGPSLPSAV
jgi:hypothetical protein